MFKTVKRIIDWCGELKGRLYAGFVFSFFSHIFAAMPLMVAAYTVGLLIDAQKGGAAFDTSWIWKCIVIQIALALKCGSVGLALAASMMCLNGRMDFSMALVFIFFSFSIFASLEPISDSAHTLSVIDDAMDQLDALRGEHLIDAGGKDIPLEHYDIEFSHVSFGYDSRQVLSDVSFTIPEKTSTAIVGPSGSGKTTICSLLARFYDPQQGSISVGGHNLKELTCDSLLSNISMVFQNVYLFNDTIRANICFGKPDATEAEMIAAAKRTRCHDFIMALPNGYDTVVGEGGGTLSGGEKQRISIARAMLKDAPIIILDEAQQWPGERALDSVRSVGIDAGQDDHHHCASPGYHPERRSDPGGGQRPHRRARYPCRADAAGRRVQALYRDPREGRGLAHRGIT